MLVQSAKISPLADMGSQVDERGQRLQASVIEEKSFFKNGYQAMLKRKEGRKKRD
jgi:hypothetical protein